MSADDYLDEPGLRQVLKLDSPTKRRTWFRLRALFAPALVVLPTGGARRGHRLYDSRKVRELLEARRETPSTGLARARSIRKVS